MSREQVRELLVRAEEIQSQESVPLEDSTEVEQLVRAAEEAGLHRESVLQALRERISLTEKALHPEALVFAKSADRCFYPARVVQIEDTFVEVEFLNGGSTRLHKADVRPFTALPGQTLNCPWPHWGWWDCKVISYDPKKERVLVSDGWSEQKWFAIEEVRLRADPGPVALRVRQWVASLALILGSGLAGAFLMRLLMR